jgi:SAM-dependent MidA family methyltransferase
MPRPKTPSAAQARWPEPDAQALAHSAQMVAQVEHAIEQAGGWISFRRYMDLVLYAPGLGYYAAGSRKLGADGDFVTAPEISPLFARCLARPCAEILGDLGDGELFEFGAGSGAMAAELLLELESLDCPPQRYRILEPSPELRQRQRDTLGARAPEWLDRVEWVEALPQRPMTGVILANEVLDAMPVQCFGLTEQGVTERGVGPSDQGLTWVEREAENGLRDRVERILEGRARPAPGYRSELNPGLGPWLRSLAGLLGAGGALLIDYGYPRHEYYAAERRDGTLLCHYRHRVHDDPFLWPGLQDITASVDFTAVAEGAVDAGLDIAGYTTQASFLIGSGLDAVYQSALDARPEQLYALSQQVQRLTLPAEMGERFQVIGLTRGLDRSLSGFGLRDLAHRL